MQKLQFRSPVGSYLIANPHKLFILKDAYNEYLLAELTTDSRLEIPTYDEITNQITQKLNSFITKGDDEEPRLISEDFTNENIPENSVAFHRIEGLILADYPYSWYFSTKRFRENFIAAENNPQISSHLFYVKSGGGEAWYLDVAAATVKSGKKPKLRLVEKVSASAAEYLSMNVDYGYAATLNEIFGSVGTMTSFWDIQPYWESLGLKKIEEYAPQSDLKNKKYNDLRNGKPEQYKEEELKPLAEQFITAFKQAHPKVNKLEPNHPVFRGETFDTSRSIEIGLINGQKLLEDVTLEAIDRGKAWKQKQNTYSKIFK